MHLLENSSNQGVLTIEVAALNHSAPRSLHTHPQHASRLTMPALQRPNLSQAGARLQDLVGTGPSPADRNCAMTRQCTASEVADSKLTAVIQRHTQGAFTRSTHDDFF